MSVPPASAAPEAPAQDAVTQDADIEIALYTLAARQAVLAELGVRALGAKSLQALLDETVVSMRTTLDADMCVVSELLPGGQAFIVRAESGGGVRTLGSILDAGRQSQAGYTLLSSEPVVVEDASKETRFDMAHIATSQGIQSSMTVIIHGRGRPYGVFGVGNKERRRFTREDVDYFRAAANVLALAAERLQTEEGLRRSEESFRSLIEHAPEGVLISREGLIVYVNQAFWSYLGHPGPESLLGRHALALCHPDDRSFIVKHHSSMLEDPRRPARLHEVRLFRHDGAMVLAESVTVPVVFDGQRCVASLVRDVTERKRIEARLQQSERLSSLGVLAAGVAHEINNPLMYVLGNLELAQDEIASLGAPEETRRDLSDLLDKARDGADRVRRIVADLKTFSKGRGAEDRVPIDVRKVMASAINLARNEIRHRANLVVEAGDVPPAMGSDSRLGQVFLNLLLNAAHAIPEGAAHRNQITVKMRSHGPDRVVIEVHDTGAGIPEEIQGKLFDPFFTTKPPGAGTGLGLAICHEIVATLDGEIAVESELGKGSCFRVSLPAAQGALAAPEPAPISGVPVSKGLTAGPESGPRSSASPPPSERPRVSSPRGRVLIVDDEPFIAKVCQRALSPEHEVEVSTTASGAIARIENGPEVDVILCDLMMPDMSGMELFDIVQQRFPALGPRFVFLSGGAFTPAATSFRERIVNPFLDKPCSPAVLRDAVRERVLRVRSGQR